MLLPGTIDLHDDGILQNCFGQDEFEGRCAAFDFNDDDSVDLTDHAALTATFYGPAP